MKQIAILIPCFNEEAVLPQLYERLKRTLAALPAYRFEIVFINDGSKDRTLPLIKALAQRDDRISYLDLTRNFGKELAMIAGLDHVDSDAVIIMDADLQHPPELIAQMLAYWRQGYDDVYTKRKDRSDEGFFKRHVTEAFYDVLQKISRIDVQKNVGDFRLLDRRCVAALKMLRESQRYTKGMFSWIGYHKIGIVFECAPRAAGASKWNYLSLINLAVEGITSFTTLPLKLASVVGFGVSFSALFYMGWVIAKTLLFGEDVRGYPTLLSAVLFLGGVQLIFLGVIGEYLGRIFNESKRRPLYLVNEYNGKKVVYQAVSEKEREILQ